MTWHEDLSLEVAVEFRRVLGGTWDRIEEALWQQRHVEHANWAEHGSWWRKTAAGRRYQREYERSRVAKLKTVTVAVRACVACGKTFELSAARHVRGRDRVCSVECRGAARRNIETVTIDGESMPLARWAERYGVPLGTVWMRRKRGWDVERALKTPMANRGQHRAA